MPFTLVLKDNFSPNERRFREQKNLIEIMVDLNFGSSALCEYSKSFELGLLLVSSEYEAQIGLNFLM